MAALSISRQRRKNRSAIRKLLCHEILARIDIIESFLTIAGRIKDQYSTNARKNANKIVGIICWAKMDGS